MGSVEGEVHIDPDPVWGSASMVPYVPVMFHCLGQALYI